RPRSLRCSSSRPSVYELAPGRTGDMTHDRSSPSADEDGSIAAILPDRQGEINLAIATDRSVVEGSRIPEGVSELIANPSSFMVAGPRFELATDSPQRVSLPA